MNVLVVCEESQEGRNNVKNTIRLLLLCEYYRIYDLCCTQTQLANKIGVSQGAYSKFVSGKMNSSKIMRWFFSQHEFVKLIFEVLEE